MRKRARQTEHTLSEVQEWSKQTGRELFAAAVQPDSINEEERTIECVWLNDGLTIPRMDYWTGERYFLQLDPKGVVLDRLNNGGPVLDSHWDYRLANQVGVVQNGTARFEDKQYKATLRVSKRPEVDGVWMDVKDRIIQNLSVGFSILENKEVTKENERFKTFLATKWEPMEISLVPVPADAMTTILHAEGAASSPVSLHQLRAREIEILRLR